MSEPDDIQPEPGDHDARSDGPPPAQDESPTAEPEAAKPEVAAAPENSVAPEDNAAPTDATAPTDNAAETQTPDDEPDEAVTHPLMGASAVEVEDEPSEPERAVEPQPTRVAQADDTSDAGSIPDELGAEAAAFNGDWQVEMSAHRIAIELKRVETRVRELLSDRDSRRKRKLAGTFRWHELEEDIIGWRADRRMAPETLEELHRLVGRRHYLFCQLRFAAGTRPTWNS